MGRINLDSFSIADTSEQKESNITIMYNAPTGSPYYNFDINVTYIHNGRGYNLDMTNETDYDHSSIYNIKASLVIFDYYIKGLIGYGVTGGMCYQLNDFGERRQIIFIPFADDATITVEEQGE